MTSAPFQCRWFCAGKAASLIGIALGFPSAVLAQGADGSRAVTFVPSITISETVTDGYVDTAGATRGEAITSISPRARLSSRAGRVQGFIDYSLSGVAYARDSSANELVHQLAASVTTEVVQDHLYLDLRGDVGRQAIRALGVQAADPNLAPRNYAQVRSFTVAPLLRAEPGGVLDFRANASLSRTDSDRGIVRSSNSKLAAVHLGSVRGRARFGWGLDASRRVVDFEGARSTEEDRLVGSVQVLVHPDVQIEFRSGVERSNIASPTTERRSTSGAGLTWTPTDRTTVAASADRRAFGHSHLFDFRHRMRRSVWRYSDRQDITDSVSAGSALVSAYDLFYTLYTTLEPDPERRDQLVTSLLRRSNLAPDAQVDPSFLTGATAVQRRRELSLALEGARTTVLVSAFVTSSRRAYDVVPGADELDAGSLRQRGLTASVSHRLTPAAALTFLAAVQQADSSGAAQSGRLSSLSAAWTNQLSPRATVSVALRRTEFDGSVETNRQNSVLANLDVRF